MQQENDRLHAKRFQLELERGDRLQRIVDLEAEVHVTPNFPKETKCIPICMPGSSFKHIVTYKCTQKQYHERKRKIIRDLCLILEMKAPNITGS
jgi:hypothetical protein